MINRVWQTKLTDTKTTDVEGVGNIRVDAAGNFYRWVKNTQTVATDVGDVLCHDFDDTDSALNEVSQPVTADLAFVAGVAISAIPAANYGWVQIFGVNTKCLITNTTNVTVAAGDYIKAVNATDYGTRDNTTTATRRTLQILEPYATHTTPSAVTKKVFIHCM